jgi:hypothetical protein
MEVAAIDELITASGEISSAVVTPSIKSQAFSWSLSWLVLVLVLVQALMFTPILLQTFRRSH